MIRRLHNLRGLAIPGAAIVVLAWGMFARAINDAQVAHRIWMAGVIVIGLPLVLRTLRDARRGRFATDIVAALSIVTAIILGEPVAGLVIVLMQSGGEAL